MAILYFKSFPGLLKLVEEVLNIIAFSCVAYANWHHGRNEAFLAASIGAFIITAILLIIRVLDIDQKIVAPWAKIELGYCVVWSVFYLITAALVLDLAHEYRYFSILDPDTVLAGGSFGILAVVVYIVDAFDKFKNM